MRNSAFSFSRFFFCSRHTLFCLISFFKTCKITLQTQSKWWCTKIVYLLKHNFHVYVRTVHRHRQKMACFLIFIRMMVIIVINILSRHWISRFHYYYFSRSFQDSFRTFFFITNVYDTLKNFSFMIIFNEGLLF